jgi:hypothetical protein
MAINHRQATKALSPWYREPWPWLLMAGPATVVVAGFVTLSFAISSFDGLVVDDYYKQGLTVNKSLGRADAALAAGIQAQLQTLANGTMALDLRADSADFFPPAQLNLTLAHATRAGFDKKVAVIRVTAPTGGSATGSTRYLLREPLSALPPGRWHLQLRNADAWQLQGSAIITRDALPDTTLKAITGS